MRHHLQYTHVTNTAHLRYPSPWHGPWHSAPPRGPRLHPTTTSPPRTAVGIPTFQRASLSCLGILEEMNQIESRISKISPERSQTIRDQAVPGLLSRSNYSKHVIRPSSRLRGITYHDRCYHDGQPSFCDCRDCLHVGFSERVFERDVRKLLVVYVAFLRHGKTFHAMPSTYVAVCMHAHS